MTALLCNSGSSKWRLVIRKNSVRQWSSSYLGKLHNHWTTKGSDQDHGKEAQHPSNLEASVNHVDLRDTLHKMGNVQH